MSDEEPRRTVFIECMTFAEEGREIQRALDRCKHRAILAERDSLLTCLRNVMAHLTSTGGSPAEHTAFRAAFAELAKYGDPVRDERVRKWAEREVRCDACNGTGSYDQQVFGGTAYEFDRIDCGSCGGAGTKTP
jgi:hypothetical protein